ncbi:cytochrome P450 [Frankia sp. AgKG'84/4]|uniref:cytochrome P450 n=1 Tax=Frankia sp. AgKG'84/4 TaxID=573490 RepID=UPI00200FD71B|nr:cytochrome P450 [Frankia sp. AgKG'84/4]MCL9794492.1 cytochrome P450 [Frankia sp. AgKG'84/4]
MTEAVSFEVPWDRTHRFDPAAIFDELRPSRALTRMIYPDGHVGWLASSYELARRVLGDSRFSHSLETGHFPVKKFGQPVPPVPVQPGMFIHVDPPEHTHYRRMLTGEFTARRLAQLAPRLQRIAAAQIAEMRAGGRPADLSAAFSRPFVLRMLSELLGFPYDEREYFAHAPAVMHDPDCTFPEMEAAFGALMPWLMQLVVRKRQNPGDDILSRLAGGGQLNDEEIYNMMVMLLFAGYETTESALTVGVFALLSHPDQLAELRADPGKLDNAVEELLRYLSVNQYEIFRTASEDIELCGHLVAKGETITVSLPAADRDPDKFPDPNRLAIDRDTAGHVAFGHGVHQCIGQNLARIQLRVGLKALLEEFPELRLAIPAEDVPLRLKGSVFGVGKLPVRW